MAKHPDQVSLALEAEYKERPCGTTLAVFKAPHYMCAFLAFASLADGLRDWVGRRRGYADADRKYFNAFRDASFKIAARVLKTKGYYNARETGYASAWGRSKRAVDAELK